MKTDKTLAQRLAGWAAGLEFSRLPTPVVHEVKRRVLDSLGCAAGAWGAEPCKIARKVARRFSATRGATLWGEEGRVPPDWAAFANGCLVRYLDYNDTYLSKEPAHPSDNIPAMIAAAETNQSNGRELILAIAMAYEVQCRFCDAASLRARGWDHVTYGAFSTALAAGRLMGLDADRLAHALGIAGVAAAALRQTRVGQLSHWKGCAFANAARHGLFAAMLAREGMTGPAPIFEGQMGFEKLVSGKLVLPRSLAGSGRRGDWMILQTSIKFWPAEYHSQSAIEAALQLRGHIDDPNEIESVVVDSHDAAVDIIGSEPEKWRPTSRETADHSLPYLVAVALMDGRVTDKQFTPARMRDPVLLRLVDRVKVRRNAQLTRLYPRSAGNELTIRLGDGRTLRQRVIDPPGHARNPLSDAQVEAKFHELADPLWGQPRTDKIAQCVWRLERATTMGELIRLMQKEIEPRRREERKEQKRRTRVERNK